MSLSSKYFPGLSPAVYEVIKTSSEWHKQNVPAYGDLSHSVQAKIEAAVKRMYSDIAEAIIDDEMAAPPD